MGRYCEDLEDMKDSGVLSTANLNVIGEDRYQDGWFKLTHSEVKKVLFKMGEDLDSMQAIKYGSLSYHDIHVKAKEYHKMERLMRWWYDHHQDDSLYFA